MMVKISSMEDADQEESIAETLGPFRKKIDALDNDLVDLLVKREKIIKEVAEIKAEKKIPAVIQERVDEVRDRCVKRGTEAGADKDYIHDIYSTIIRLSCEMEEKRAGGNKATKINTFIVLFLSVMIIIGAVAGMFTFESQTSKCKSYKNLAMQFCTDTADVEKIGIGGFKLK